MRSHIRNAHKKQATCVCQPGGFYADADADALVIKVIKCNHIAKNNNQITKIQMIQSKTVSLIGCL